MTKSLIQAKSYLIKDVEVSLLAIRQSLKTSESQIAAQATLCRRIPTLAHTKV
jgi:hypothetical protein